MKLEREARAIIRKGEIDPFELPTLLTANALDYSETVINLLGTMKREDPRRSEGLTRIKRWVDQALAGDVATLTSVASDPLDAEPSRAT